MPEKLPTHEDSTEQTPAARSANEELSARIATALQTAGLLTSADAATAEALLNSGTARAGDWRALLERNLSTSTI